MENINTLNSKSKEDRNYDPILDDPIDSESDDNEQQQGSDSDGLDVEFPRNNANELMTSLHREITNI
jgi:hypothetical protein